MVTADKDGRHRVEGMGTNAEVLDVAVIADDQYCPAPVIPGVEQAGYHAIEPLESLDGCVHVLPVARQVSRPMLEQRQCMGQSEAGQTNAGLIEGQNWRVRHVEPVAPAFAGEIRADGPARDQVGMGSEAEPRHAGREGDSGQKPAPAGDGLKKAGRKGIQERSAAVSGQDTGKEVAVAQRSRDLGCGLGAIVGTDLGSDVAPGQEAGLTSSTLWPAGDVQASISRGKRGKPAVDGPAGTEVPAAAEEPIERRESGAQKGVVIGIIVAEPDPVEKKKEDMRANHEPIIPAGSRRCHGGVTLYTWIMRTDEFDYNLPPERIAQQPVEPRDSAKLMVLHRATGRIEHRVFREIGGYLRPGDLLVLNDTRVIPARLYARKARTGGRVEILLLEPVDPQTWWALVGGRRVRVGTRLEIGGAEGDEAQGVKAVVREAGPDGQRLVEFGRPVPDWIEALGHVPLPPYIHGYTGDPERYQTVYARREGSVAAPTAGLHFTPELLLALRDQGARLASVTLRIGLDTFKPISETEITAHRMHSEWAELTLQTARQINETKLAGGRVVAAGTTAVRTLETAALRANPKECEEGTCTWNTVSAFTGPTDLYITPGYRFRAVDALLTNFHLPRSTLIVLVSAFAGVEMIRRAYQEAMEHDYRFYSFGDAMLIV
jgi:S-adenosylmethionine:tRNA ribosyltransferase-isomerase